MFRPDQLEHPIVCAPLGGGPTTPELVAAVTGAGGLGVLAAGYRRADVVRTDLAAVRALTRGPVGVNVFAPPGAPGDPATVARYAAGLAAEAERYGAALGQPRHDDDDWEAKLALLVSERPAVASFTFGLPPAEVVGDLHARGVAVWVTVTTPAEAVRAVEVGADALVCQGVEAGGHRGGFDDAAPGDLGLLALLQLAGDAVNVPLVAAGGIVTARAVAAVLVAGAAAAQLGTAFMRTPEAGTAAAHRKALASGERTALTRAFSGRTARGVVNRFMREHEADAPAAYPEVHHLTAPLRAAARAQGDPDGVNLWAGQAHRLARELPAAELTRRLGTEARDLLTAGGRRVARRPPALGEEQT